MDIEFWNYIESCVSVYIYIHTYLHNSSSDMGVSCVNAGRKISPSVLGGKLYGKSTVSSAISGHVPTCSRKLSTTSCQILVLKTQTSGSVTDLDLDLDFCGGVKVVAGSQHRNPWNNGITIEIGSINASAPGVTQSHTSRCSKLHKC